MENNASLYHDFLPPSIMKRGATLQMYRERTSWSLNMYIVITAHRNAIYPGKLINSLPATVLIYKWF